MGLICEAYRGCFKMTSLGLTDKERVAFKIVDLAKAQALADNHFLSAAVGRLKVEPSFFLQPFSTDGLSLFINADMLCAQFRRQQYAPKHDLIHAVLHCVFLHPYVSPSIDRRFWDLACDIAVERNVAKVCGARNGEISSAIESSLDLISQDINGTVTAEKIYQGLRSGKWVNHIDEWESIFLSDDHSIWYTRTGNQVEFDSQSASSDQAEGFSDAHVASSESNSHERQRPDISQVEDSLRSAADGDIGSSGESQSNDGLSGKLQGKGAGSASGEYKSNSKGSILRKVSPPVYDEEKSGWIRVAKALAINLQTYSKERGMSLGSFVEELEESSHKRVDYADFLRQFAIPGEVLKISDDEFDYVYYTYGLKLYGNLPLIEPLEYREEKRIREFVIVIDTSGSVYGEIVKRFIDTTFDILKSTEAFFERIHVRIIQSDAAVQADDVITNLDELKEWGRTMRVYGRGGTDFRPAFAYVDKLIEDGEFENLGGLIYFTDGWGTYPEWMPEYKTAFVFYDDSYRPECVPAWAAQIVLDENLIPEQKGIESMMQKEAKNRNGQLEQGGEAVLGG